MKLPQKYPSLQGGKRRRRPELAPSSPLVVTKPSAKEDRWVDDLSDDEFTDILGPSWVSMTPRERQLYPNGLSQMEKDVLWGYQVDDDRPA